MFLSIDGQSGTPESLYLPTAVESASAQPPEITWHSHISSLDPIPPKTSSRKKYCIWTEAEVELLKIGVKQEGMKNWDIIVAKYLPNFTAEQCKRKCFSESFHKDPELNPNPIVRHNQKNYIWTFETTKALVCAIIENGLDFNVISTHIPDTTPANCYDKWSVLLKNHFTPEEKIKISHINFPLEVDKELYSENPIEYLRSLCVGISETIHRKMHTPITRWTLEENELLVRGVLLHGSDWGAISAELGSRDFKMCRDHWRYILKTGSTTSPFSVNQGAKLKKMKFPLPVYLIPEGYSGSWIKLAKSLVKQSEEEKLLKEDQFMQSLFRNLDLEELYGWESQV